MGSRIDKYLFAMRIYKTRSIAADACKKGRVTMNGVELKSSRLVEIGNKFSVRKGPVTYTYEILRLSENRLGAKLVPEYMRDITSKDQLEILELARLAGQSGRDRGTGRPTKKDRRDLEQFISDDWDTDLDDLDYEIED
ncbi:MAG: RNA-binding S4 domain-containing protein [Paludibacteraceae bacterium]|nr:RNA-binding S4 domain-containing protein [Paludibacteraceae bacterium]